MINNKRIVVVMPAFNAALTLKQTLEEVPRDLVDVIILTDDASRDETLQLANQLKIDVVLHHENNMGYGANQKTCYKKAVEVGADIIIMLHPDYQYTPKLIPSMAYLIANDVYSVVLGSRILGKGALKGGMPLYKYIANRLLTFFQNIMTGAKLSEYHTGYRAFSVDVLKKINYDANSNDFVFDNQFLSQVIYAGYEIAEITCPAKYFKEASSINFLNSIRYGAGVVIVSFQHFFQRIGVMKFNRYNR
jgi:glycosyltransferase involved in cell wall biosynthesis